MTTWLLKVLGLVCRVRGCELATYRNAYCLRHKNHRFERTT